MCARNTTCMHFTNVALRISLDKFYAALRFVSLLLDCMNVHIRCRSRSASGGGREGAECRGRPIGTLFGPLVRTRGP